MTEIAVEHVTVTVQGHKLLDDFSLNVAPGEVVALLGPNGAGKTTLLRCVLGLIRPSTGHISIGGRDNLSYAPRERARLVAHLSQHTGFDEWLTALEYVETARFCCDESRQASQRAAEAALARAGAADLAHRRLGPLSGGERQRIALAALLAQAAPVLLLDEPANHLDPARQAHTYALLGDLQRDGSTLLIVTHDINLLSLLRRPGDVRIVGMREGRRRFELPYAAETLGEELSQLYDMPMHRLDDQGRFWIVPSRLVSQ